MNAKVSLDLGPDGANLVGVPPLADRGGTLLTDGEIGDGAVERVRRTPSRAGDRPARAQRAAFDTRQLFRLELRVGVGQNAADAEAAIQLVERRRSMRTIHGRLKPHVPGAIRDADARAEEGRILFRVGVEERIGIPEVAAQRRRKSSPCH